jgi:hypothetical protein
MYSYSMSSKTPHNTHSDFWLDEFEVDFDSSDDTQQLVKMSMARRAVSNFVNILTGKTIPVVFNDSNDNMTDGSTVFLSSDIVENKDFDPAVGLALHEGSHVVLTDFNVLKTIWQNIPREMYNVAGPKGFSKLEVAEFVKNMFNYVEDRFIDNYVYTTAPGYRGYYKSLYEKYFHSEKISLMLKSDMYRKPTIAAYESRIINLTNQSTDLDALPGLRDIAKLIDIKNISRLKKTDDRYEVAVEVASIVYSHVGNQEDDDSVISGSSNQSGSSSGSSGTTTVSQKDNTDDSGETNTQDESDDADDILGGGNASVEKPKDKEPEGDENADSTVSKKKREDIYRVLKKQKVFVSGQIKKKKVSGKQRTALTQLDNAGVTIVNVGTVISDGLPLTTGVDCVFVKNLTKELLFSNQFPCKAMDRKQMPLANHLNAVNRGIQLGTVLGRKLKVRSEINTTKYMRKSTGRIDRRVLSELGFDNENVFYRLEVDKFKSAVIHISVDASSSMCGEKWINTLTVVTAICKAASMINNLRVSVSLRSTSNNSSNNLPYVAIVYDSAKDSFTKVRTMFPYLSAEGSTPEGLCYEAIMDSLGESSNDEDYYFLNFSDGEPAYCYHSGASSFLYDSNTGSLHTRRQVNNIRSKGYKVLAYFIREYSRGSQQYGVFNGTSERCFKTMYGQDASFVDVTNIIGIARTMNQMFLEKENKI